jgi:hypothetical protein
VKSSIFFTKGYPQATHHDVKVILEVNNEALNERYLGMPTDVGASSYGTFKFLLARVWNKVKEWLEKILSTGGKEVLINQWYSQFLFSPWHVFGYLVGSMSTLTH